MEVTTLYVFLSNEFGGKGNKALVVLSEHEITHNTIRKDIAKKNNAPVTCFINKNNNNIYFHGIQSKLPFCIHGTLAASKVLLAKVNQDKQTFIMSDRKTITVQRKKDIYQITTRGIQRFDVAINKEKIAELLGTKPENLGIPEIFSIGSKKCLIPIKNYNLLNQITPNFKGIREWSLKHATNGFYIYSDKPLKNTINFQARSFNPLSGNNEDLATGVAAGLIPWKENINGAQIIIGQGNNNTLNKIFVSINLKQDETLISGKVN